MLNLDEDDKERFLQHVNNKTENECWPWLLDTDKDGYGRYWLQKKTYKTHRLAYYFQYNIDPNELHVLHTCDNPPCCNPHHLWLGTHLDNMHDCRQKNRNTVFKNMAHPLCKYSNEQILEIREEWANNSHLYGTLKEFAIWNNMTPAFIGKIIHHKLRKF